MPQFSQRSSDSNTTNIGSLPTPSSALELIVPDDTIPERHPWEDEFLSTELPEIPTTDYLYGEGFNFTKHLDVSSGRYYYFDHVSQLSTWEKPMDELNLFVTEEMKESKTLARWNAFIEKKLEAMKRTEIIQVMRKKRANEREKAEKDTRKREENALNFTWRNALMAAAGERYGGKVCDINYSWIPLKIDPILYSFEHDYGVKLRALRLVGVDMVNIPDEIGNHLHNLEVLSVANNKLKSLPDSIVELHNLTELNALHNQIEQLPLKIGLMGSLTRLDLANNRIKSLPSTFAALSKLERLVLEHNNISILPENLEFMKNCKLININFNKLTRIPFCLPNMPSLTSFSAVMNELTYIPRDIVYSESISILRLSRNKIKALPDIFGELSQLTELSIDFNNISNLPSNFYMLEKLTVLRLEGNESMVVPPQDVIAGGAVMVVEWCRNRWLNDEHFRRKAIISSLQDILHKLQHLDIIDPSVFEPNVQFDGDTWFAVQLNYLFKDLMPAARAISRERYGFLFSYEEVLWAVQKFEDANGAVLMKQIAQFRRCSCKDENGRRKPCIPPRKGFMCSRACTLIKTGIVLQADRRQRIWLALRKKGIEDAVRLAENEAKRYLQTKDGQLWIKELSFNFAEDIMTEKGVGRVVAWREKKLERKKLDIIRKYDGKKKKLVKARDARAAAIRQEISTLYDKLKKTDIGYLKETLEQQIDDWTAKLANMTENEQLLELQSQCEEECKKCEEDIMNVSSSSEEEKETEENGSVEPLVTEEQKAFNAVKAAKKKDELDAKKLFLEEETVADQVKDYLGKEAKAAAKKLSKFRNKRGEEMAKQSKEARKAMRSAIDTVNIRYRRAILTLNGDFKETQQVMEHDLARQYIKNCGATARREAEHTYKIMGRVRQNWDGLGIDYCFNTWVVWVKSKTKRLRRDLRREYRTKLRAFESGLATVRIAQLNVSLWRKQMDVFNDIPFWEHRLSGEKIWQQPRLENYVPVGFEVPVPPTPLPEGVSLDSSESEGEAVGGDENEEEAGKEAKEGESEDKDGDGEDEEEEEISDVSDGSTEDDGGGDGEDEKSDEDDGGSQKKHTDLRNKLMREKRKKQLTRRQGMQHRNHKVHATTSHQGLQSFLAKQDKTSRATTAPDTAEDSVSYTLGGSLQSIAEGGDDEVGVATLGQSGRSGRLLIDNEDAEIEDAEGCIRPTLKYQPRWPVFNPNTVQDMSATEGSGSFSPNTEKGVPAVMEYAYGPDSLRGAVKAPTGTLVRKPVRPVFDPPVNTDIPSSRELDLQKLSRDFILPTLAAIEEQTAIAELESLGMSFSASKSVSEHGMDTTTSDPGGEDTPSATQSKELELVEAEKMVLQRRGLTGAARFQTYKRQVERRKIAPGAKWEAFAKESAARKAEDERKRREEEAKNFKKPNPAELLALVGKTKEDLKEHGSGKIVRERTAYAKEAMKIKNKLEAYATNNDLVGAPKKKTFYEKELKFMFDNDYKSDSDSDDEAETGDTLAPLPDPIHLPLDPDSLLKQSNSRHGSTRTGSVAKSLLSDSRKSAMPSRMKSVKSSQASGSVMGK